MPLLLSADDLRDVLMVGANVSDETLERISASAEAAVLRYLTKKDSEGNVIDYSTVPGAITAIEHVAVDFYQSRKAPGGQSTMLDVSPAPRVNAFIVQRAVAAYLADYIDVGSYVS
jgi:hypothetical protein